MSNVQGMCVRAKRNLLRRALNYYLPLSKDFSSRSTQSSPVRRRHTIVILIQCFCTWLPSFLLYIIYDKLVTRYHENANAYF